MNQRNRSNFILFTDLQLVDNVWQRHTNVKISSEKISWCPGNPQGKFFHAINLFFDILSI